mmetsp:Transcript_24367/g.92043  ORF Transcript_24367/g.92043 Transcript_24367/m.92043 type:complete len:850 (-) Transcript_24367:450-2999(-)
MRRVLLAHALRRVAICCAHVACRRRRARVSHESEACCCERPRIPRHAWRPAHRQEEPVERAPVQPLVRDELVNASGEHLAAHVQGLPSGLEHVAEVRQLRAGRALIHQKDHARLDGPAVRRQTRQRHGLGKVPAPLRRVNHARGHRAQLVLERHQRRCRTGERGTLGVPHCRPSQLSDARRGIKGQGVLRQPSRRVGTRIDVPRPNDATGEKQPVGGARKAPPAARAHHFVCEPREDVLLAEDVIARQLDHHFSVLKLAQHNAARVHRLREGGLDFWAPNEALEGRDRLLGSGLRLLEVPGQRRVVGFDPGLEAGRLHKSAQLAQPAGTRPQHAHLLGVQPAQRANRVAIHVSSRRLGLLEPVDHSKELRVSCRDSLARSQLESLRRLRQLGRAAVGAKRGQEPSLPQPPRQHRGLPQRLAARHDALAVRGLAATPVLEPRQVQALEVVAGQAAFRQVVVRRVPVRGVALHQRTLDGVSHHLHGHVAVDAVRELQVPVDRGRLGAKSAGPGVLAGRSRCHSEDCVAAMRDGAARRNRRVRWGLDGRLRGGLRPCQGRCPDAGGGRQRGHDARICFVCKGQCGHHPRRSVPRRKGLGRRPLRPGQHRGHRNVGEPGWERLHGVSAGAKQLHGGAVRRWPPAEARRGSVDGGRESRHLEALSQVPRPQGRLAHSDDGEAGVADGRLEPFLEGRRLPPPPLAPAVDAVLAQTLRPHAAQEVHSPRVPKGPCLGAVRRNGHRKVRCWVQSGPLERPLLQRPRHARVQPRVPLAFQAPRRVEKRQGPVAGAPEVSVLPKLGLEPPQQQGGRMGEAALLSEVRRHVVRSVVAQNSGQGRRYARPARCLRWRLWAG